MMKTKVNIIFPDIYSYQENLKIDNNNILNVLKNEEYHLVDNDLRCYASNNYKLIDKLGDTFKDSLYKYVNEGLSQVGFNIDFNIKSSWATKVEPNGSSDFHSHANYWIAGVYYTMGEIEDNLSIIFERTLIPAWQIICRKEFEPFYTNAVTVNIKKGDLILFPCYLKHKVGRNNSSQDRYSLAFNIMPKGNIGNADSQNEL